MRTLNIMLRGCIFEKKVTLPMTSLSFQGCVFEAKNYAGMRTIKGNFERHLNQEKALLSPRTFALGQSGED